MKMVQKILISSVLFISASTTANADTMPTATFVFIKDGKVNEVAVTNRRVDSVNVTLDNGRKAPKNGATTLILEEGKKPTWTTEAIRDVDKRYGGDGSPEIKIVYDAVKPIDLDEIPEKKPANLDPIPEKKPTEIFDTPSAAQPEDGTWQLSVISNTYDASCPKDPFPPKSIAGMTRPVNINWDTPWKPTPFFEHYPNRAEFTYKQLSPTQWSVSGVPFKLPSSSSAAAPNVKVLIEENFTLVNPRELKVNATLTMKMSVRGMKLMDCKGHLKMLAKHRKGPKIKIN